MSDLRADLTTFGDRSLLDASLGLFGTLGYRREIEDAISTINELE